MIPVEDGKYNNRFPAITYIIILINVLVFFGTLFSTNIITTLHSLGVSRQNLTFSRLFSSLFTHAGWFHLVTNMFFLGFFGRNTERRLTPLPFISLYLLTGTLGAIAQVLSMKDPEMPLVGASACVYGVMATYITLFPKHRIKAFYLFAPHPACSGYFTVPAYIYVLLFFVMQDVLMLMVLGKLSQVGHIAHLTGFSVGAAFAFIIRISSARPQKEWQSSPHTHSSIKRPESRLLTLERPSRVEKSEVTRAAGKKGEFWVILKEQEVEENRFRAIQQRWKGNLNRTYFLAKNISEEDSDKLLLLLSSYKVPAIAVEAVYIPSAIPVETVVGVGRSGTELLLLNDAGHRYLLKHDNVVFLSTGRIEYHHHKAGSMTTDRIFYSISVDIISRHPFRNFRVVRHPKEDIDSRTYAIITTISDWGAGLKGVEQLSLLASGRPLRLFSSFDEYDVYLLWQLVLSEIAECR